jgi:hypothetical protein
MVFRKPAAAPASALPAERRGQVVGRFCKVCASIYGPHVLAHRGRPILGRDHIASPCPHEGDRFVAGAEWWEPAVEMLPPPAAPA